MATYLDINKLQILCTCEKSHPISRLYFCRHCLKMRCSCCVSHEVDGFMCPNCMDTLPSGDAKKQKNRCATCFDCPSCGHTLSTRATMLMTPNPSDPSQPTTTKMFYMSCNFCRWTTRDAGIKDQKQSSSGLPDPSSQYTERISSLTQSFHQMAIKEKLEKEHKKYNKKRNYIQYGERYGLTYPSKTRSTVGASTQEGDQTPLTIEVAEAVEDVPGLDEESFVQPTFEIEKISTITQRLMSPDQQPSPANDLTPRHKLLVIKRSLRCRECEHNLLKPEYNASSIKFKINSAALYHIPEVRINKIPEDLTFARKSKVVLTVTNPVARVMTVKFSPIAGEADEISTAKMTLPESQVKIGAKEETNTVEYDANTAASEFKDDPNIIAFRRSNKVGVNVQLTPMKSSGPVTAACLFSFEYRNTSAVALPSESHKANETHTIQVKLLLDFGTLSPNVGGPPPGMPEGDIDG